MKTIKEVNQHGGKYFPWGKSSIIPLKIITSPILILVTAVSLALLGGISTMCAAVVATTTDSVGKFKFSHHQGNFPTGRDAVAAFNDNDNLTSFSESSTEDKMRNVGEKFDYNLKFLAHPPPLLSYDPDFPLLCAAVAENSLGEFEWDEEHELPPPVVTMEYYGNSLPLTASSSSEDSNNSGENYEEGNSLGEILSENEDYLDDFFVFPMGRLESVLNGSSSSGRVGWGLFRLPKLNMALYGEFRCVASKGGLSLGGNGSSDLIQFHFHVAEGENSSYTMKLIRTSVALVTLLISASLYKWLMWREDRRRADRVGKLPPDHALLLRGFFHGISARSISGGGGGGISASAGEFEYDYDEDEIEDENDEAKLEKQSVRAVVVVGGNRQQPGTASENDFPGENLKADVGEGMDGEMSLLDRDFPPAGFLETVVATNEWAERVGYSKNKEILRENFKIYTSSVAGPRGKLSRTHQHSSTFSTPFGCYRQGKIRCPKRMQFTSVLVKTFPDEEAGQLSLGEFLQELKILSWVGVSGGGENSPKGQLTNTTCFSLLNMQAAFTKHLYKKSCSMFFDFAVLGPLSDFLGENRGRFKNVYKLMNSKMCSGGKSRLGVRRRSSSGRIELSSHHFSTSSLHLHPSEKNSKNKKSGGGGGEERRMRWSTEDLVVWAAEVAEAMEFLHDKQVVHGNLSLQSTLLTADFVAKVADAGHAPSQTLVPLPPPELHPSPPKTPAYTKKSDIWRFGTLVHLLFSLGELRYLPEQQDLLNLHKQQQQQGNLHHQLPSKFFPGYSRGDIQDFVERCWNPTPSKRPDFHLAVEIFARRLLPEFKL